MLNEFFFFFYSFSTLYLSQMCEIPKLIFSKPHVDAETVAEAPSELADCIAEEFYHWELRDIIGKRNNLMQTFGNNENVLMTERWKYPLSSINCARTRGCVK